MSHQHQIILQTLQHLSESTHGSSHQIRPLNSVTPPQPPAPARLPAPLCRSSVPPLTLSSLLPISCHQLPALFTPLVPLLCSPAFSPGWFLWLWQPTSFKCSSRTHTQHHKPAPPPHPALPLSPHHSCWGACSEAVSWKLRCYSRAPACEGWPRLSAATVGSSGCRSCTWTPRRPDACDAQRTGSDDTGATGGSGGVTMTNWTVELISSVGCNGSRCTARNRLWSWHVFIWSVEPRRTLQFVSLVIWNHWQLSLIWEWFIYLLIYLLKKKRIKMQQCCVGDLMWTDWESPKRNSCWMASYSKSHGQYNNCSISAL